MSAEIFEKDRPFDPEHHPAVQVPDGVDRRAFMMRTAAVGAAALIAGRPVPTLEAAQSPASAPPPLSPDLEVVKKVRLPVMTTLVEFYKVGPGPSSSHTIGPMRITYDFYNRATKLPADQLAKAPAIKVHLGARSARSSRGPAS
jgi:L-serine dehydratase